MRPGNARCNETKGFWSGFWAIVLTPKKGLEKTVHDLDDLRDFLLVDLILAASQKKKCGCKPKNNNTVRNYNYMNNISKLFSFSNVSYECFFSRAIGFHASDGCFIFSIPKGLLGKLIQQDHHSPQQIQAIHKKMMW